MRWVTMSTVAGLLAAGLAACTTVRSDAWVGQPVDRLETHPLLRTLPMIRTINTDGLEQRTYQNRANAAQCYAEGGVATNMLLSSATYAQTMACTGRSSGCDFVFTVRDARITRYEAGGRMLDARGCAASVTVDKG